MPSLRSILAASRLPAKRHLRILFPVLTLGVLAASSAAASTITLGTFSFDSNEFGNTLTQSDGGTFAANNWLNTVNVNPGSPGYLTGANFNTGIANIGLGSTPSYTIGYGTGIVNGTGADFGVVTGRFSTNDTITLTVNGVTRNYGPGLGVTTGVTQNYYYGGGGPFGATLFVTSIDLSDFQIAAGSAVSSITVTGSPELDLIRLAGFAAPQVTVTPEPSSFILLGTGLMGVAAALRRKLA